MSDFEKPLSGYRWVEIRRGDTLQAIALREFNDASVWASLAHLNDLRPPYITDDPLVAGEYVLMSGQLIMLPAATPSATAETNPDLVFGKDCLLKDGNLVVSDGDFVVASGRPNLKQALTHRIHTTPGDLMFHADYGCQIRKLIGSASGETASLLAGQYVRSALEQDERVQEISRSLVTISGDAIKVDAEAVPVSGNPLTFEVEF